MAAEDSNLVRRIAFWGIPLAFGVMGLKLLAWWVTGSVALLSDGLESTVNVIAAFIAYFVIRYAQKPADEDHPYGHHKAEYLSAVLEGVLIVVAALLIIREAVAAGGCRDGTGHRCTHSGPGAEPADGPAVRNRQPSRRRFDHRHRRGGARAAGRLHLADDLWRGCDECVAV